MEAVKHFDYKGREVEPGSPTAMFVQIADYEAVVDKNDGLALENEGHTERRIRWGEEFKRLRAEMAALQDGGRIAADINRLIGEYNAQVSWSGESMAALIEAACAAADLLGNAPTPTEEEAEAHQDAVKAIHDVMAVVPCSSLYSLAEAVIAAGYTKRVLEPVVYAKVSGTLDEIDAVAWPFINAEAVKVGPQHGRIETYQYNQANGGVIVLWNGNRIHAMAVTIRDDLNCTRCIRMLAAQDG